MRSVLTTLGIVIGVAAVIAVVSIVQGLQFLITDQLQGSRGDLRDRDARRGSTGPRGSSVGRSA